MKGWGWKWKEPPKFQCSVCLEDQDCIAGGQEFQRQELDEIRKRIM
ncbi:MAG: hypothetical protein ACLRH0_11900 [Blautia wexlerae]